MSIDFQAARRMFLGWYETELNSVLRQVCQPSMRCFDIGGNVGYDALVLAKLTRGDVLTVECDERLCAEIAANAALNP